jgi:hypothetical protein
MEYPSRLPPKSIFKLYLKTQYQSFLKVVPILEDTNALVKYKAVQLFWFVTHCNIRLKNEKSVGGAACGKLVLPIASMIVAAIAAGDGGDKVGEYRQYRCLECLGIIRPKKNYSFI